mmetsp:Transcript_33631/g.70715  ORF Transcript_33631/g.70715 Transcript_33631/m.70715 type:complete len:233 (+) Transcript_33631:1016-1714(+)
MVGHGAGGRRGGRGLRRRRRRAAVENQRSGLPAARGGSTKAERGNGGVLSSGERGERRGVAEAGQAAVSARGRASLLRAGGIGGREGADMVPGQLHHAADTPRHHRTGTAGAAPRPDPGGDIGTAPFASHAGRRRRRRHACERGGVEGSRERGEDLPTRQAAVRVVLEDDDVDVASVGSTGFTEPNDPRVGVSTVVQLGPPSNSLRSVRSAARIGNRETGSKPLLRLLFRQQ